MLDRWFIQKLSGTGRVAYIVGQLVFLGIALGVLLGVMDMSFREAQLPFIGVGLGFIVVWGFVCTRVWPKEEPSTEG